MSEQTTPYSHDGQPAPARTLDDILLEMERTSAQYHKQLSDSLAQFIMRFDMREESCMVFDTSHTNPTVYTGSQCVARATGRERRHKHKHAPTTSSTSTSASTSASTSEDDGSAESEKKGESDNK
jgi:hypothetical protein